MFKKTLYGLEKDGTIKVWSIETTYVEHSWYG